MADEKKQGEVIALNMDRLKTIAELDRVIKYIDGFSLFKKMFVDGMGAAPENLESIWHDLQIFRLVILGKTEVDDPDYKLRIDRHINALVDKSEVPDSYRIETDVERTKTLEQASSANVYARFVYDEKGEVDLTKSNIRPWVVEICRSVFRQMDLCVRGGVKDEETGRLIKPKCCFNNYSCDQIFLVNNQKFRGAEQMFCTKKCQKNYHARMAMRKKKGNQQINLNYDGIN